MTALATADTWTSRYREALSADVIRQRATIKGVPVDALDGLEIEVACAKLEAALKAPFLLTTRGLDIMRSEIERALAHAGTVYADPRSFLRSAYSGVVLSPEPYMPTIITGPAGIGKTRLRLAIARVLSGRSEVCIDESHIKIPLIDYVECVVGSHKSVTGVLRPLAGPEIAAGKVKVREHELPKECARWQRLCGTCLLGADELQFMTQSSGASTLVTQTMLALSEVHIPWFVIANYSLCWKLLARPPEATQRLLGRPALLFPDAPESPDWKALVAEYQVIGRGLFDFKLSDHLVDLWNLSAGLKRELVKLLVHAYRIARRRGYYSAKWEHVLAAFGSVEFSVSRRDINLLIAHAAQGGELRKDLQCPFTGSEVADQVEAYAEQLRKARETQVANAVLAASLNAKEKLIIEGIKELFTDPPKDAAANVIPIKRRKKPTLASLTAAGRHGRETRRRPPSAE